MINKIKKILNDLSYNIKECNVNVYKGIGNNYWTVEFNDKENFHTFDFYINSNPKIGIMVHTKLGRIGTRIDISIPESDKSEIEVLLNKLYFNCESWTKDYINNIFIIENETNF